MSDNRMSDRKLIESVFLCLTYIYIYIYVTCVLGLIDLYPKHF